MDFLSDVTEPVIDPIAEESRPAPAASLRQNTDEIADLLMSILSDGLDHPELWPEIPGITQGLPDLLAALGDRLDRTADKGEQLRLIILIGMYHAANGQVATVIESLDPVAARFSQSPLMQGALFYLNSLLDPDNPKYDLQGRVCRMPFVNLDVLERSAHLCCSSYLPRSIGNLQTQAWEDVWNSDQARNIRASIHDGSYRYCNKMTCPSIQSARLSTAADMAAQSDFWRTVIRDAAVRLNQGPQDVNLAYDRTCNLSCPSCRIETYAADSAQRAAFDLLQETKILPLLKGATSVYVTGSGDPFASKNFRQLLTALEDDAFAKLKFRIMTNAMLLTPRQWASFPVLHGRTSTLRISVDAATGPTHERLRRGARWSTMLENMAFAGELLATGQVDLFGLAFTVQVENFAEMGDACDLAHRVGASEIYFGQLTNWGTYSAADFQSRAVWLPSHPQHDQFVEAMQDARLRDPIVQLGEFGAFVKS
ncbi:MAG TPA: SPASM domain-containing protein [Sphingomonas sp.]|jgi:sulfatase maturation enzyme AslB (radical SAM superfamily)|uniref:SPASM domain-containing protein n=1 Tax=Sphingomonas sp. TaxID=28214 RepID=UPI002ED775B0